MLFCVTFFRFDNLGVYQNGVPSILCNVYISVLINTIGFNVITYVFCYFCSISTYLLFIRLVNIDVFFCLHFVLKLAARGIV